MSASIEGWFDFMGLYFHAVNVARPGGILVEVGSWHGKSFLFLARVARQASKGLICVSIDHGLGSPELACKMPRSGTIAPILTENIREAGLTRDVVQITATSALASRLFAPGSCEFVFLDASHDYASVKADIEAWRSRVRPGGILAGHDYPYEPGVAQAVQECFGDVGSLMAPTCWQVEMEG